MSDNQKMTVSSDRVGQFIDIIADQAREAMHERSDDMLKAWHENIEEAEANEKPFPPLKIGIAAAVDIEAGTIETTVRFTATYQTTIKATMEDPNQLEFPNLSKEQKAAARFAEGIKKNMKKGESVTIEAGGKSATIQGES